MVIPVHCEQEHVSALVDALAEVLPSCVESHEILFVDDGSSDDTWRELEQLASKNAQVSAISLSRRFGKEAAISAGLGLARGRGVVVMDGDLQHPPSLIPKLVDAWRRGADIAEAVRRDRDHEARSRRVATRFYEELPRRDLDQWHADKGETRVERARTGLAAVPAMLAHFKAGLHYFSEETYSGQPAKASAELGERILDTFGATAAEAMAELLDGELELEECHSPVWKLRHVFVNQAAIRVSDWILENPKTVG